MMPNNNMISGLPLQSLIISKKLEGVQETCAGGGFLDARKDPARLKQALCELESLFISYLFKEMRAAVPRSGFINGGRAEELYTSMLDNQLAKELALRGGIGLSDILADRFAVESEKESKISLSRKENY